MHHCSSHSSRSKHTAFFLPTRLFRLSGVAWTLVDVGEHCEFTLATGVAGELDLLVFMPVSPLGGVAWMGVDGSRDCTGGCLAVSAVRRLKRLGLNFLSRREADMPGESLGRILCFSLSAAYPSITVTHLADTPHTPIVNHQK